MMKLYDYFRSSASFRVRIALNIKDLSFETVPIHLVKDGGEQFSSHYQKLNPQNLVPTFIEGDRILTQSLAIIEYLDEIHPSPSILPVQPFDRALVRSFALSICADIHPLNNLRVLKYLQSNFSITDAQKDTWYQHWITLGFHALENHLSEHNKQSDFCFGNQLTLADICLIPQMYNAKRFNCTLDDYPILNRIYKNCEQLEAVTNAWPEEKVN